MAKAPLSSNIAAGFYSMTYKKPGGSAVDCGKVEGVRRLVNRPELVLFQSDQYGDCDIDAVYRGRNANIVMTFKEWSTVVRDILFPWASGQGDLGVVGRMASAIAGEIVLTPVASTPAATLGPTLITIPYALVAPGNDISMILGAQVRDIPVMFKIFPYDDGGTVRFYEVTQP